MPAAFRLAALVSPVRSFWILVCLLFAGAAEGLGIASLLPVIVVINDPGEAGHGKGAKMVAFLEKFGIHPTLDLFLLVLVGGMATKAILTLVAMNQVGYATADVATKVRLGLVDALVQARWSFFIRQPIGRLSAAIGGEASQTGQAYGALAQFVSHFLQVLVYVAIAGLFSWQLSILSIVVGMFIMLTLNRFVTSARRTAKQQRKRVRGLLGAMTDLLVGIKPIKAMGRQARFHALFRRDVRVISNATRKQEFAKQTNRALQEPILAVCLAVGIYVGISYFKMSASEVVIMALILARTVSTMGKAQQDWQTYVIAEQGFEAIEETISAARAMREPNEGGLPPHFERDIEFRDVVFEIEDTRIIHGVSFTVPRGRVTTIHGTSGAGKTTLVDLLLGLHKPTEGQILIDGTNLADFDLMAWQKFTGYVPQELMLFHDTIAENVTLGQPEFTREDVERALEQAGAMDFVSKIPEGIDTVVGERGARLSGGQRQRIAIARALVHQPRLLILDEATTALDPATEAAIVANVCRLSEETGLTVLAISHQPAWARAAQHLIHLKAGQVAEITDRTKEETTPSNQKATNAAPVGAAE